VNSNDTSTFHKYAVLINRSAVQTYRLLENLLEWASAQRGKLEFVPVQLNLYELVNEEITMAQEIAGRKNIELNCIMDKSVMVRADKNMIRTIIRNLISNAIKFTHKNGKVEITARPDHQNTEVSVSDNGIGMSDETISKLFRLDANLMTKGTDNEKGTGLGLFLCKEFAEKHDGKIWVTSELGKGSTFRFILPSCKKSK
jgi:two-component system sensor histidine kinase/response regulator